MFDDSDDDLFDFLPFFEDDKDDRKSNPLRDLLWIAVCLAILIAFYFWLK